MLPSASFRATSILTMPGRWRGISTVDQKPGRALRFRVLSGRRRHGSETSPSRIQRVKRRQIKGGACARPPNRLAVDQDLQALDVLAAVKCRARRKGRARQPGRPAAARIFTSSRNRSPGIEFRLDHSDRQQNSGGCGQAMVAPTQPQNAIGAYSSGEPRVRKPALDRVTRVRHRIERSGGGTSRRRGTSPGLKIGRTMPVSPAASYWSRRSPC